MKVQLDATLVERIACNQSDLTAIDIEIPVKKGLASLFDSGVKQHMQTLVNALVRNRHIVTLGLSGNPIEAEPFRMLAKALAVDSPIAELHLAECKLGDGGGKWLARWLRRPTELTQVHVPHNRMSESAMLQLAEAMLSNHRVYLLDLTGNTISGKSVCAFAKMLESNTTLTHLSLPSCQKNTPTNTAAKQAIRKALARNREKFFQLMTHIKEGQLKEVRTLLMEQVCVNQVYQDEEGIYTPLHAAIRCQQQDMVELLLPYCNLHTLLHVWRSKESSGHAFSGMTPQQLAQHLKQDNTAQLITQYEEFMQAVLTYYNIRDENSLFPKNWAVFKGKALVQLKIRADNGSVPAQIYLGRLYFNCAVEDEKETEESYRKGTYYLECAIKANHLFAVEYMALRYFYGEVPGYQKGTPESANKTILLFEQAASRGSVRARASLGNLYWNGDVPGYPKNEERTIRKALDYLMPAVEQGDAGAFRSLGIIWRANLVPQSIANFDINNKLLVQIKTRYCYEQAAVRGDYDAFDTLINEIYVEQGVEEPYPAIFQRACAYFQTQFEEQAAKEHPWAIMKLGEWYGRGFVSGFPKHSEVTKQKALGLFARAEALGDAEIWAQIGYIFYNYSIAGFPRGSEQAINKVHHYYQRAAEQDHGLAQNNLALLYNKGLLPGFPEGSERARKKAQYYYGLAAIQGEFIAYTNLGAMYQQGEVPGYPYDSKPAIARANICFAAARGDETARRQLMNWLQAEQSSKASPALTLVAKPLTTAEEEKVEQAVVSPLVLWQIHYSDLTFQHELGRGGFGVVHRGRWQAQGVAMADVAIKELHIHRLSSSGQTAFRQEAELLSTLRHPHVVGFYGVVDEAPHYCLVMEYCPKGDLFTLLHNNQVLPWRIRMQMGCDIAAGLTYLHGQGLVHGDLKSPNVLLDDRLRAKVSDFGLSQVRTETKMTSSQLVKPAAGGSVAWMAPELFTRGAKKTKASDIYSLGMVFWEIASRKIPYADAQGQDSLIISWITQGEREAIPKETPQGMAGLLARCWEERTQRPQAFVVLEAMQDEVATVLSEQAGAEEAVEPPAYAGNLSSRSVAVGDDPLTAASPTYASNLSTKGM